MSSDWRDSLRVGAVATGDSSRRSKSMGKRIRFQKAATMTAMFPVTRWCGSLEQHISQDLYNSLQCNPRRQVFEFGYLEARVFWLGHLEARLSVGSDETGPRTFTSVKQEQNGPTQCCG